ncbi:MAG: hypothetical protein IH921_00100 [Gemmatimonadetes bacterium]|nr:hypothetical protein [Gemmatimonadota bacterium]
MTAKKSAVAEVVESQDLDLLGQLGELGTGTTIQVYREPGRMFLEAVEPDAIAPENLKLLYGGGNYSLRARRDGTWVKGVSMVRIQIAGDPKPGSPGQPPLDAPPASSYNGSFGHPPGSLEALRAEFEAYRHAHSAGGESNTMVQMMTTLLVPVLTTALQRQPENSAVEILELARKLAKDQRDAANQAPESDPIRDLGIPLLDVIQRGLPIPSAPRPALPPGEPAAEPAAEAAEKKLTPQELAVRIATWCEPLERRDADPAMRAWCFLEDMQDSPLLDATLELIRMPGVLDLWSAVSPRVAEKREWYASFVDELRRLTDDSDAHDSARDPGDAPNVEGNGEPSTTRESEPGDSGART